LERKSKTLRAGNKGKPSPALGQLIFAYSGSGFLRVFFPLRFLGTGKTLGYLKVQRGRFYGGSDFRKGVAQADTGKDR
jgi:hypothetical protein